MLAYGSNVSKWIKIHCRLVKKFSKECFYPSCRKLKIDQQAVGRLSRMDAMQQQSMEKAKQVRRIERIKLINSALKRLEAGDYGFCLNCDAHISNGRLKLDPTFSLCIDCAR